MIIVTSSRSAWGNSVGQRLIERARLLLAIADRRKDLGSALPRNVGGVVGAVVRHHDHVLRRPRLPPQGVKRRGDRDAFVVRRDQHGESKLSSRDLRGVRELARRRFGLCDQSPSAWPEWRQHGAPELPHLRRQRGRDAPVTGQHAHRCCRMQGSEAHEEARHRGPGGHDERELTVRRRWHRPGACRSRRSSRARTATHTATARRPSVRAINPTVSQPKRASRRRRGSGIFGSTANTTSRFAVID